MIAQEYTTQKFPRGLSPIFNESFVFGQEYDLHSGLQPTLKLYVYHKPNKIPLGQLEIDLDSIKSGVTSWYLLEKAVGMPAAFGSVRILTSIPNRRRCLNIYFYFVINQIRLTLTITDPITMDEDHMNLLGDDPTEGNQTFADQSPNELHVGVLQGKDLLAMDNGFFQSGLSDPMIKLKIPGIMNHSVKTKYIPKTLNPQWNEKFVFPKVTDPGMSLEVTCEDYDFGSLRNDVIGRFTIPLELLSDKKPLRKWYTLLNKYGDHDEKKRGEVELQIQWRYNPNVAVQLAEEKMKTGKGFTSLFRAKEESDDEEQNEEDEKRIVALAVTDDKKAKEDAEERKKIEEDVRKQASEIEIKDGDYQIQVHIIEARDLKAENADGSSDPCVFVECFGKKQHTRVIKGQLNCVWDEMLIFNLKAMSKETFQDGVIQIAVRDANLPFLKKKMIGSYAFDATSVYFGKDHEFYRQWVALMDDEDAGDTGVQGYLKISVLILGPGDKQKPHNETEDIEREKAREKIAGGDVTGLILMPPTIKKTWKYIVVTVYRGEALPVMDGANLMRGEKTDAFVQVEFGGGKPHASQVVTVQGVRRALNPIFNCELWYPISYPTSTQIIKISTWDWDAKGNELIAYSFEKFNVIFRLPGRRTGVKWVNMYGAPEYKDSASILDNIRKLANRAQNFASSNLLGGMDPKDFYNHTPEKASMYKGRVLLNVRIEDSRPPKKDAELGDKIIPFSRKVKAPPMMGPESIKPKSKFYSLKALLIAGSELPIFHNVTLSVKNMQVRISIGQYDSVSNPRPNKNGLVEWNELMHYDGIELPEDVDMIPDIFIYLIIEGMVAPVCFTRVSPADLLKEKFRTPAKWFLFHEDRVLHALNEDDFAGQVLIKLGLGFDEDFRDVEPEWLSALDIVKERHPFLVRVNLYQCRDLVAADSNGLCDPFIKIKFGGQTQTSSKKKKTLYPTYYETFDFEVTMTQSQEYMPMVTFELFDSDFGGQEEYLGVAQFNMVNAILSVDPNAVVDRDPTWINFFYQDPGDSQGAALVSVVCCLADPDEEPPKRPSIVPPVRDAYVEMIVIGLRNLQPYNFQAIQNPYLEIESPQESGKTNVTVTKTSRKPTPSSPNFLERYVIPIKVPVNPIFTQPLFLRVVDSRLGGLTKPVVAVGVVDLSTKIPGSKSYVAPQSVDVFVDKDYSDAPIPKTNGKDGKQMVDYGHVKQRVDKIKASQEAVLDEDDYIVTQLPHPDALKLIEDRKVQTDSGAGLFGALQHLDLSKIEERKRNIAMYNEEDSDEDNFYDDEEQKPKWMKDRNILPSDLEDSISKRPFETYTLYRGKKNGIFGGSYKPVGLLKGLIRITFDEKQSFFEESLLSQMLKPRPYKMRLYVLESFSLAMTDTKLDGQPAPPDPYLKVTLGNNKFDDRKNAVDDMDNCPFYKLVEMDAELPGTSQLIIDVMDKDMIGGDDLIGTTVIDLEDRFFESTWQSLGEENLCDTPPNIRWKTKPVETRTLQVPGSNLSRGTLQVWVDIMAPNIASTFPPDDVSLPPTQVFEMRIVIWKAKDVPAMDSMENMRSEVTIMICLVSIFITLLFLLYFSDLFVKCWPEGCTPQTTDTHWRAKKGKASWNYRLLFEVELGHSTRYFT